MAPDSTTNDALYSTSTADVMLHAASTACVTGERSMQHIDII